MAEGIEFEHFRLSIAARTLTIDVDTPIHLSRTEVRLLSLLMQTPNAVVTREQLLIHLWQDMEADTALRSAIYRLRRKIEPDPKHPRYILQLGEGYLLNPNSDAS